MAGIVRFTETLRGHIAARPTETHLFGEAEGRLSRQELICMLTVVTPDVDRMIADPFHRSPVFGCVIAPRIHEEPLRVERGHLDLFFDAYGDGRILHMRYELHLRDEMNRPWLLQGIKIAARRKWWPTLPGDTTTLFVDVYPGESSEGPSAYRGVLRQGLVGVLSQASSFRGDPGAFFRFIRFYVASLWRVFTGPRTDPSKAWSALGTFLVAFFLATFSTACGEDFSIDTTPPDAGSESTSDDGALTDVPPEAALLGDASDGAAPAKLFGFVGAPGGKIYVYSVNETTGAFSSMGSYAAGTNPSFLAFDTAHARVYSVDEKTAGQAMAFQFTSSTGALTEINHVSSSGAGPTHLSIDSSGKFVLVANYTSGSVAVLPIQSNGGLGAATDTKSPGAKAHLAITNPSGGHVFVPCLGANVIAEMNLNTTTGTLSANGTVSPPASAGPRHLAFLPNETFAYGINETASSVTAYSYASASGTLNPIQTISTLPTGFSGSNTGAEIVVHPTGKFVFGSNRGHDSIVTYSVHPSTGMLSLIGHTSTGSGGTQTPRSIAIDPEGSLIFSGNSAAGNVTGFRIESTGALTPLGIVASGMTPTFVGLARYP